MTSRIITKLMGNKMITIAITTTTIIIVIITI